MKLDLTCGRLESVPCRVVRLRRKGTRYIGIGGTLVVPWWFRGVSLNISGQAPSGRTVPGTMTDGWPSKAERQIWTSFVERFRGPLPWRGSVDHLGRFQLRFRESPSGTKE